MFLVRFRDAVTNRWRKSPALFRRRYVAVGIVLATGILLSTALFLAVRAWEIEQSRNPFRDGAADLASQLRTSLASDEATVASIRDLFLADNETVDRQEFRVFAAAALERNPHIQALEWVPRVPSFQRTTYEDAVRGGGYPRFQFTEKDGNGTIIRAGPRNEYFPVYYVEPMAGNQAALGYDLGSDVVRLDALRRASDTGMLAATARVTLVQDSGDQFGFLLFMPIYGYDVSGTPPPERRLADLSGFAAGVFRMGDLAHTSFGDVNASPYVVSIYDESAPPGEQLLYTSDQQGAGGLAGSEFQESFALDVGGRKWSLVIKPRSDLGAFQPISLASGAFAAGLLMTILLAAYLKAALGRETELSAINVELNQEMAERKLAEAALRKSNRALRTLSEFNQSLVRATSEPALLESICSVAVELGGYRMAWVGIAQHDGARTVSPVAWAGYEEGYLEHARISWADDEHGRGATGRAIRTGDICIVRDTQADLATTPWAAEMDRRGYRSSVALPLAGTNGVFGALNIYSADVDAFDAEETRLLAELATDLAFGLCALHAEDERRRATEALKDSLNELRKTVEGTIKAMAATSEMRDPYTAGHQRRTAQLATAIARDMGLPDEEVEVVTMAAEVHDVGKVSVPAEILSKPGKLSELEFRLVKGHSQSGCNLLRDIEFPRPIAGIILQHHERMDGSGYPSGLSAVDIVLGARILAVADVVEAMVSHRPYRPALGLDAALDELSRNRGTLYDSEVVDACLRLFAEKGFAFE